ncbi:hypothetical protein BJX64DRAFT_254669 [Aspergillus heterothallicus]
MPGPFQHPPSDPNSPLSPNAGGATPVSFRTNVNRAKTRRWVEAKKYTYDGDDWGEDEYGEYEYDDEAATPQTKPTGANQSTPDISSTLSKGTSHPPLPSQDRSRSMERVQTMPTDSHASNDPPTPIVRPADIYRRMREEQKAQQPGLAQPSATESALASPPSIHAPAVPGIAPASVGSASDEQARHLVEPGLPSTVTNEPPTISLPDVRRLSAFDPDFFPTSGSHSQTFQGPESEPPQLQHNPSLGFRSAVNQAFDVPETPSTIADSVARSNSDSTTAISPIINRRGTADDKTPTIEEDPNESNSQNQGISADGSGVFKPGHRRDLSLPSPGNSPSRRPIITEPNATASSELAQISAGTPSESFQGAPSQHTVPDSISPSQSTPGQDLPAPLNVHMNVMPGPTVTTDHVPVIIPSISSDNSPEDTENDRLRKEIIRSLSRENTPSDQQDHTPPQTRQDNLAPSESYWNGPQSSGPPVPEAFTPALNLPQVTPEPPSAEPLAPIPVQKEKKPKLQRRFSWEESSDDEDSTPITREQPSRPPPMPGQYPFSQESIHPDPVSAPAARSSEQLSEPPSEAVEHVGGKVDSTPQKPKLTVIPPTSTDSINISSSSFVHEPAQSANTETLTLAEEGPSYGLDQTAQSLEPPAQIHSTSASIESGLLGFKDILGFQSPEERVKAFDRTREQFAFIDTGLSNWIQVTLHAHPEHSDVVDRNSKPLSEEFKNTVPRTKFPKLSSLGNLASSLQEGSHSSSGHIRRPSAPLGSIKQHQVGKDFLHTAGVLGGQAGKAAKGLFSKGRSKLKGSGGTEKGFQSSRGYHRPVRISDLQPGAESSLDLETSQHLLHDSLLSRPWATNQECESLTRRGGEEFFVRPRTPPTGGQSVRQSAGQQRAVGVSDPCPGEGQGEAHQDYYSLSFSQIEGADSHDVEQFSAKPRDSTRPLENAQSDEMESDKNAISFSQKEPSPPFQTPALSDTPDQDTLQVQDQAHLPLRQLPSVSSLGVQEADPLLDPPPPLAQKLTQNHSSSQVSLLSDLGNHQPRHLGGRIWSHRRNHSESPLALHEGIHIQSPPVHHKPRPASTTTPRLLSPLSPQHDWSRRPEQSSSSRDPASHRISSSPMEKLKNVGRFRRISMGSNQAEQSPKKHFRLTGLFSRTARKSGPLEQTERSSDNSSSIPPLASLSPRPGSRIASSSISSFDHYERPVSLPDARDTLNGRRPPTEGYFAHESPESFSVTQPHHGRLREAASSDRMRLSDPSPLDPARLSPHLSPPYRSPQTPRRQQHVTSPRLSSPIPSPVPRTPPSRGRSEDRTYAQELHFRSRSPKAFAPRPEERNLPKHDPTDPAFRLGTFRSSNPRTSRVGDQELPWKITIPGEDETTMDPSASWRQETVGVLNGTQLPTYQEDVEEHGPSESQDPQDEKRDPLFPNPTATQTNTPQLQLPNSAASEHPHRPPARAINSFEAPVELPVRADDDSSEEIMMSSTAYPGQEWRPLGFSEWEHQP